MLSVVSGIGFREVVPYFKSFTNSGGNDSEGGDGSPQPDEVEQVCHGQRIGGTLHTPLHKTLIQLKTTPEIKKWLLKPSNRIARLFLQYPTIGKSLAMILGALGVYAGYRGRGSARPKQYESMKVPTEQYVASDTRDFRSATILHTLSPDSVTATIFPYSPSENREISES